MDEIQGTHVFNAAATSCRACTNQTFSTADRVSQLLSLLQSTPAGQAVANAAGLTVNNDNINGANYPPSLTLLSTFYTLVFRFSSFMFTLQSTFTSTLLPLISSTLSSITTKPDLASIVLLLVVLFLSLKVLGMLLNTVLWWVRLVFRLAFWGGIVGVGLWVWIRGAEGVVGDLQSLSGVWAEEYRYWQEKAGAQGGGGMGGGLGGTGRGNQQGGGRAWR